MNTLREMLFLPWQLYKQNKTILMKRGIFKNQCAQRTIAGGRIYTVRLDKIIEILGNEFSRPQKGGGSKNVISEISFKVRGQLGAELY